MALSISLAVHLGVKVVYVAAIILMYQFGLYNPADIYCTAPLPGAVGVREMDTRFLDSHKKGGEKS